MEAATPRPQDYERSPFHLARGGSGDQISLTAITIFWAVWGEEDILWATYSVAEDSVRLWSTRLNQRGVLIFKGRL